MVREWLLACETAARIFRLRSEHFQSVMGSNPDFADQIKKLASDRLFELKVNSGS